jgi:hypothetical protein
MTPRLLLVACAALLNAACGGGGAPLGNPTDIQNPVGGPANGKLSFVYFQKCINPIFLTKISGSGGNNSCAASGCHDNVAGTGGALRLTPSAAEVDTAQAADNLRASDMYKNFYSAQGVTLVGSPVQSRLIDKPLLQGVLHGGGLIFDNPNDPLVQRMRYWIGRPVPQGQDEFSASAAGMFTPPDPSTGACNTQ